MKTLYVLIQLEYDIYQVDHEDHYTDVFPEYNCLLLMNLAVLLLNFVVFVFETNRKLLIFGGFI